MAKKIALDLHYHDIKVKERWREALSPRKRKRKRIYGRLPNRILLELIDKYGSGMSVSGIRQEHVEVYSG